MDIDRPHGAVQWITLARHPDTSFGYELGLYDSAASESSYILCSVGSANLAVIIVLDLGLLLSLTGYCG